jgi:hypothetical protein
MFKEIAKEGVNASVEKNVVANIQPHHINYLDHNTINPSILFFCSMVFFDVIVVLGVVYV